MNEYLQKFLVAGGSLEPEYWWGGMGANRTVEDIDEDIHMTSMLRKARSELVYRYSFAIPTDEAISRIAALSPLIEIGAGSGYWSMLLAQAGADIVAFDNRSWEKVAHGQYYPVKRGGPRRLLTRRDRTLFLCWPPYHSYLASNCLRLYTGGKIAFIGERFGCTGTDHFCHKLEDQFDLELVRIPQWPYIHDYLFIGTRKKGVQHGGST